MQTSHPRTEEENKKRRKLLIWFFSSLITSFIVGLILFLLLRNDPFTAFVDIKEGFYVLEEGQSTEVFFNASDELGSFLYVTYDPRVVRFEENRLIAVGPGTTTIMVSSSSNRRAFDTASVTVRPRTVIPVEPEVPVEPEPEVPVEPELPVEPEPEVPVVEEPKEEVVTPPTIYTVTITNETGAVITTLEIEEGSFINEDDLDLPELFKGFLFEGQACADESFDLETPITENLTLIQASYNQEAPCLQLDYIVLSGRPVAGTTLTVDIFPIGANVTISWYTSVNNRTYREIPGESSSTFTVRPEDSGKFIRVYVVSDSNPPVVRYDTIKLDVFGTVSNPGPQTQNVLTQPQIDRANALIAQGFIPIASPEDFLQIWTFGEYVFAAGTIFETTDISDRRISSTNYVLVNNIDASSFTRPLFENSHTSDTWYQGIFDGNGLTIRDYKDTRNGNDHSLFGGAKNATFRDLRLDNFDLDAAGFRQGSLVSQVTGSIIFSNITVTSLSIDRGFNVGGLVGEINNDSNVTFNNIHIDLTITGISPNVGGLVGAIRNNAVINISNVSIRGEITGGSGIGGLIGYSSASVLSISRVSTDIDIVATDWIGGLIGYQELATTLTISESYTEGLLQGRNNIGGYLGFVSNSTSILILNSYNLSHVSGSGNYFGGFIGQTNKTIAPNIYSLDIINSYNSGSVSGPNGASIIGQLDNNPNVTLTGVYALEGSSVNNVTIRSISGTPSISGNILPISVIDLTTLSIFTNAGWDIANHPNVNNVWTIGFNNGLSYPWLSWQDSPEPIQLVSFTQAGFIPISNREDFEAIGLGQDVTFGGIYFVPGAQLLTSKYFLTQDIDLSTDSALTTSFIPQTFSGTIEGQGYTISGLAINASTTNIGLFNQLGTGASIQNITISSFNITSSQNDTGLLAGKIENANDITIQNVLIENSSVSGINRIGGIIGYVLRSNISINNINSNINVNASGSVGGLLGYVDSSAAEVTNIQMAGTVSGPIGSAYHLGGIIGTVTVSNTHVTLSSISQVADVTGQSDVGGLIGKVQEGARADIENSFNLGNVTASSTGASGGLVGGISSNATVDIVNSYNAGTATGDPTKTGAIIGEIVSSTLTLTSIYYLTGTAINNKAIGVGTITSGTATAMSVAQMTALSTFNGWDIAKDSNNNTTVWTIQYDGQTTYPWLTFMGQPQPAQIIPTIPVYLGSDLKTIEDNLFGSFVLENDIDLSSYTNLTRSFIDETFTGNLSGAGFKISNLSIDADEDVNYDGVGTKLGLFKTLSGAAIDDLVIDGFIITGTRIIGALAGEVFGSDKTIIRQVIVTNSSLYAYASEATIAHGSHDANVGGLIGRIINTSVDIIDSESKANVESPRNYIGGFVGQVSDAQVNFNNLTFSGILRGGIRMGGIIGLAKIQTTNITISSINISTNADIEGFNQVGGVFGDIWNNLSILGSNITIKGNVSARATSPEVGSIIGRINLTPVNQVFSNWTGSIRITNIIDEVSPFIYYIGNSSHYQTPNVNDRTVAGQIEIP